MDFPTNQLLSWYRKEKRDLPWRHTSNIYKIWVSEVMLQQTQVQTVIPYYNRFLKKFPAISDLGTANHEDVLKVWEGLGYYNRCRNLWRAAKIILSEFDGEIPNNPEKFKKLPGVGPYIQAAVMSISQNHPLPVVDGNVIRVMTRFFGIYDNIRNGKVKRRLEEEMTDFIPKQDPGDFNQGIMELGALICTPASPRCDHCPVQIGCHAFTEGKTGSLPVKSKKKPVPEYRVAVGIILDKDRFLIQKRPPDGHLGGMWEFPGGKSLPGEKPEETLIRECREELGIRIGGLTYLTTIHHAYTHFKIHMDVYICNIKNGKPEPLMNQPIKWITIDQLDSFPFPGANHKFFPRLKSHLK